MRCKRFYLFFQLFSIIFCNYTVALSNEPVSSTFINIDEYVQKQMKNFKIPGAAIGIVQSDRIAYLKGYGIAGDNRCKVTPKTPFLIASVSKSFTALGIMQLVEDGKIDLDAPVKKYLPWFQTADTKASSEITVRNLLYQTSGF